MLSSELNILSLYGLFVCLTLIAQTTGALNQLGMGYLLSSRDEARSPTGIAARLDRALMNSIVAMALFAPVILILDVKGAFSAETLIASQVFLLVRVLYVPAYALNLVGIRTLLWLVGFGTTAMLYLLSF